MRSLLNRACAAVLLAAIVLLLGSAHSHAQDERRLANMLVDAFKEDKDVVPWTKTGELRDLLSAGKAEQFNRLRQSPSYAGRYIEISTRRRPLILVEARLADVDLSRMILTGADFSGSDLTGASFKESYLTETSFYRPPRIRDAVTQRAPRPTRLEKTDFTGAAVEGKVFSFDGPSTVQADFTFTDCSAAIGLPDSIQPAYQDLARAAAAGDGETGIGFFAGPADERLDAADFGKPCANPFKDLTAESAEEWSRVGVDVKKLAAMKAIRVEGEFGGALSRHVINKDANCVLVIGSPFFTHDNVYSLGPVVALEEAHFMGSIFANAPIWFREESFPRGLIFAPAAFADTTIHLSQATPVFTMIHVANYAPASGKDSWVRRMLTERTITQVAQSLSHNGEEAGKRAAKWFRNVDLKEELGAERYEQLLKKHPEVVKLKAVAVGGLRYGALSDAVVNADANTVLVLKAGFGSHDGVFSAGPVVSTGAVGLSGPLLSQKWIMPFGEIGADRVIALAEHEVTEKNEP